MGLGNMFSNEYFPSLQNSEAFFEKIFENESVGKKLINQILILCFLTFLYGMVMGIYHSLLQAVVTGCKVSILFVLALLICFPAFFIVQYILGSMLKLHQIASIVLSGFILMGAIMLSFAPIVIIFLLTGSNYYFLQLLHIGIFIFSGIFGMNTIIQALKYSCEKKNIYPQTGVVVFRFWVVILAFVGIQLAWNFRPFLGDRGQPFELFRNYEGNFYTAVIYSANKLFDSNDNDTEIYPKRKIINDPIPFDTLTIEQLLEEDNSGN